MQCVLQNRAGAEEESVFAPQLEPQLQSMASCQTLSCGDGEGQSDPNVMCSLCRNGTD